MAKSMMGSGKKVLDRAKVFGKALMEMHILVIGSKIKLKGLAHTLGLQEIDLTVNG